MTWGYVIVAAMHSKQWKLCEIYYDNGSSTLKTELLQYNKQKVALDISSAKIKWNPLIFIHFVLSIRSLGLRRKKILT